LSNLREYALAADPLVANRASSLSVSTEVSETGERRLVCRYRRLAGARNAVFALEESEDLRNWSEVVGQTSVGGVDPTTETEEVRMTTELGDEGRRRFIRLRVDAVDL